MTRRAPILRVPDAELPTWGAPEGENFWDKASEKARGKNRGPAPPKPRRRPWRWILLSLALVAVLLVVFAPAIGSVFVPGIVRSQAARRIAGEVRLDSASLSWFGAQSLNNLQLLHGGKTVANLSLELDQGLLGLAAGSRRLGTATLRGRIDMVRFADGTTNLERALSPLASSGGPATGGAGASEPFRVPDGAAVRLVLDSVTITFRDESVPEGPVEATLRRIDADAALAAGEPLTLKLKAEAAMRQGSASPRGGSVALDARVDKWMGSDGALTPERITLKASLGIQDLPIPLLDALLGRGGTLTAGLGERLHLDVNADGSLRSGQVALRARAGAPGADPAATADLSASIADGVLTLVSPAALSLRGAALRAVAPGIDEALKSQDALQLDALPDVRVTVSALRAPLPRGGTPLDLRRSRLELQAEAGGVTGRVRIDDAAPPRAMALAPISLGLSAPDLAGPVRVTLATSARVADESGTLTSAGTVDADLTLAGLLDAAGAPLAGIPSGIEGRVRVRGVATALAQPFIAGLDLPRDIGPTLDLDLTASAAQAGSSDLPPTDLHLRLAAQNVNALASLTLREERISTRGEGVRLTLHRAGGVLGRFLDPALGLVTEPAGAVDLSITDLSVPLSPGRTPIPDRTDARARLDATDLRFRASDAKDAPLRLGRPLTLDSVRAEAMLAAGRSPAFTLAAVGEYDGRKFTIDGGAELADVFKPTPAGGEPASLDLAAASPSGSLHIRGLPTSLFRAVAALAPAAEPSDPKTYRAGDAIDLARLLQDAIGPAIDVTFVGDRSAEGRLALDARVESRGVATRLKGVADDRSINLEPSRTRLTLDPAVCDRLLATFADPAAPRPSLAAATGAIIDLGAMTIPRAALDDPALLPAASLALGFDRHLIVHGVTVGEGAERRDLGPLGLAGFSLRADLPLATLAGAATGALKGLVSGDAVFTDEARRVASFNGEWSLPLSADRSLAGPLTARFRLVRLDTAAADAFLASARLVGPADPRLVDLLGSAADASLALTLEPPTGQLPLTDQLSAGRARLEATFTSPHVSTRSPLRIAILPDRLSLTEPLALSATLNPDAADRWLGLPAGTRLDSAAQANVALQRLAIARPTPEGPASGPLKPGVFDLSLQAELAPLQITSSGQRMTLTGARVQATGLPLSVALDVAEAVVHAGPASPPQTARNLVLRASADHLADAQGRLTADRAVLNAQGDLPLIPTALIDALAGQDGLLLDALGPTVALTLRAENLSPGEGTGTLVAEARSDRAVATIQGRMTPGLFVVDQAPLQIGVSRVTPDLSRRLTRGLPLLASVEKTPDMQPASLIASNLRVPTDGSMSNLSGDAEIDPGVVRFATSPLFARVLARAHQRAEGAAGERLQPLRVEIRQGVVRMHKWELPLGEFKVLTEGSVNLVTGDLDVITWIPLGALSEEAARAFRTTDLLAGVLGKSREEDEKRQREILAPFRSRGKMGSLGPPVPDPRLFAEEVGRTFKDEIRGAPRRVLEELLRDRRPPP
jgi:hypothetical protein